MRRRRLYEIKNKVTAFSLTVRQRGGSLGTSGRHARLRGRAALKESLTREVLPGLLGASPCCRPLSEIRKLFGHIVTSPRLHQSKGPEQPGLELKPSDLSLTKPRDNCLSHCHCQPGACQGHLPSASVGTESFLPQLLTFDTP